MKISAALYPARVAILTTVSLNPNKQHITVNPIRQFIKCRLKKNVKFGEVSKLWPDIDPREFNRTYPLATSTVRTDYSVHIRYY